MGWIDLPLVLVIAILAGVIPSAPAGAVRTDSPATAASQSWTATPVDTPPLEPVFRLIEHGLTDQARQLIGRSLQKYLGQYRPMRKFSQAEIEDAERRKPGFLEYWEKKNTLIVRHQFDLQGLLVRSYLADSHLTGALSAYEEALDLFQELTHGKGVSWLLKDPVVQKTSKQKSSETKYKDELGTMKDLTRSIKRLATAYFWQSIAVLYKDDPLANTLRFLLVDVIEDERERPLADLFQSHVHLYRGEYDKAEDVLSGSLELVADWKKKNPRILEEDRELRKGLDQVYQTYVLTLLRSNQPAKAEALKREMYANVPPDSTVFEIWYMATAANQAFQNERRKPLDLIVQKAKRSLMRGDDKSLRSICVEGAPSVDQMKAFTDSYDIERLEWKTLDITGDTELRPGVRVMARVRSVGEIVKRGREPTRGKKEIVDQGEYEVEIETLTRHDLHMFRDFYFYITFLFDGLDWKILSL